MGTVFTLLLEWNYFANLPELYSKGLSVNVKDKVKNASNVGMTRLSV